MRFHDRRDAGRHLAEVVAELDLVDPVVLALPRGGLPVAAEVADVLGAALEVFVARKVGAPGHPEYGIGAVAEGSERIVLSDQAHVFRLSDEQLERMAAVELAEVERRVRTYRGDRQLEDVAGRDVVLVDDGLATGVTAEAALQALAQRQPGRLVLAVPVCARQSAERLGQLAEVVCVRQPEDFRAVGLWYDDFGQTTDAEVIDTLERHRSDAGATSGERR